MCYPDDPPPKTPGQSAPRMVAWFLLTMLLVIAALVMQDASPGSVMAVTLYKAHLMALGGWGGYWLDRALFPYDRPHAYLEPEPPDLPDPRQFEASPAPDPTEGAISVAAGSTFGLAMLRRAVVVAACLICVGLGA